MSRTGNQWIERTGGFRPGESQTEFLGRTAQIKKLEKLLVSGTLDMAGLEKVQRQLCALKGINFDSYDGDDD